MPLASADRTHRLGLEDGHPGDHNEVLHQEYHRPEPLDSHTVLDPLLLLARNGATIEGGQLISTVLT